MKGLRKPMPDRKTRLDTYRAVMAAIKQVQDEKGEHATINDMAKAARMDEKKFVRSLAGLRMMGVDVGSFQRFFIRADIQDMARELGFIVKPKGKKEPRE